MPDKVDLPLIKYDDPAINSEKTSGTMLTRNLYEIDEVVAALQLCLWKRWPQAMFWAWELFVSEELFTLKKILKDSWLSYGAPHDLRIFYDVADLKESAQVVGLVGRIMEAIKKTGSLSTMSLLETEEKRPNITKSTRDRKALKRRAERSAAFVATLSASETIGRADAAKFWISLDSACRSYWFRDAFWLLQAVQPVLSADAIWSAIQIAGRGQVRPFLRDLQASASANPVDQILHQAAAISTLCRPSKAYVELLETPTIQALPHWIRDWASWDAIVGRRSARIHAIPTEALHRETTRGALSSTYTNIIDVREPVLLVSGGCTWWRRITTEAGFIQDNDTNVVIPDDEAYEAFYDTNFPDDIPDEWSAADQQKSHGRGLAETAAAPCSPHIREEAAPSWSRAIHVPARKT